MSDVETPPGWTHLGPRSWTLSLGIVSVVAGVAVLFWPRETLRVAAILFALQLVAAGVFRFIVSVLPTEERPAHRVQAAMLAGFATVVGVLLLSDVDLTLAVITIVLGVYWGVYGIMHLVQAIGHADRAERRWAVVSGTMGLVVGLILLLSVAGPPAGMPSPVASLLLLVRVLGVWLVVYGAVNIFRAVLPSFGRPAVEQQPSA